MAAEAGAVGAPAGTPISNTATATFEVGGTPLNASSAPEVVTVDELVDVTVTLLSPPVTVAANDTDRVLTFTVTNVGNGIETFELDPFNTLGGDDFDPVFASIYLDADGNGVYDGLIDTLYTKGGNDPVLDANTPGSDSVTVFLLNDIPGTVVDTNTGLSRITATSLTTGAASPGDVTPGAGDGGTDAMAGTTGGQSEDTGTYIVASVNVSLTKSSSIVPHAVFGTEPVPGATIHYTITVTVTGGGTADNLVVTDLIPANTLYENNSLFLDAVQQTDVSDSPTDESDYNVTTPGGITVDLGNVAGGSPANVIEFNVLIDPN